MGISAVMVHWLARLYKRGTFAGAQSVVELCPQDIMTTPAVVRSVFEHLFDAKVAQEVLNGVFDGGQPKRFSEQVLYRTLGIMEYRSIDMFDQRADWRLDLNLPFKAPLQFSVVTNFGSSEHIFNIAQSFRTIHELLEPGGVALFVLPAFGDIDHGFWNVHPTVYFDVAEENGYTIEDFVYVDNFGVRSRLAEERPDEPFSFRDLPVKMEDCMRPGLARMVSLGFLRNLADPDTGRLGGEFPCFVFDYCFVAMRKPASGTGEERSFSFPTQGRYRK